MLHLEAIVRVEKAGRSINDVSLCQALAGQALSPARNSIIPCPSMELSYKFYYTTSVNVNSAF